MLLFNFTTIMLSRVCSWWGHVDASGRLAEQSHCQTGEFPQEIIKGSLSISTHTHLSPGFLSHAVRALAEESHRALILLQGSPSGLAAPASSFPGLPPPILSYPDYAFGIHCIPHLCNLWPRWSFKVQANLECPWTKSTLNCKNAGDIIGGVPTIHFFLLFKHPLILSLLCASRRTHFHQWLCSVRIILLIGSGTVRHKLIW